jgi:hypothetical protein
MVFNGTGTGITGNFSMPLLSFYQLRETEDVYFWCDTSSGPVNITIPAISEFLPTLTINVKLYFKDLANNASVNAITITVDSTDKINSGASVVINTNGGVGYALITSPHDWLYSNGTGSGATFLEDFQIASDNTPIGTTSSVFSDMAGMTLTSHSLGSNGKYEVFFDGQVSADHNSTVGVQIVIGGTPDPTSIRYTTLQAGANYSIITSSSSLSLASGEVIKVQWNIVPLTTMTNLTILGRSLKIIGIPIANVAP